MAKRSTESRARKTVDKAVEPIVWRSAEGLVRQLQPELGLTLALTEITNAARNEHEQLRTQVRAVRGGAVLCVDLTIEHWRELKLTAVMDIATDERGFPTHKGPWTGNVRLELADDAFFPAKLDFLWGARLFVCEADCRKLWPIEKPPPKEAEAVETEPRRGRRPSYDRDAITYEVVRRLVECGEPRSVSKFAEQICDWYEDLFGPDSAPDPNGILRTKIIPDLIAARRRAMPKK